MKHKIQVVMLPTEDRTSKIWFDNDIKEFILFDTIGVMNCTSQHLYITISPDVEPIKEGDNIFNRHMNRLEIASKNCEINSANDMHYNEGRTRLRDNILKVISTTDPKLLPVIDESDNMKTDNRYVGLPQLQQSFIREFVVNPDGEFEVEYEQLCTQTGKPCGMQCMSKEVCNKNSTLKLNQDNTVNITYVEKKMYSLSDLERLGDYAYMNAKSTWDWKKFIKTNL